MPSGQPLRICIVAPSIYPLFNSMCRGLFTDSDLQLYELARVMGKDEHIEINVLTSDFGQEEVEYYAGVLVFRGNFQVQQTWKNRLLRREPPLLEQLKKIDAQIYLVAGASGWMQAVAAFCQTYQRAFVFRISHQRDCDGTFIHGDAAGKEYQYALHHAHAILCQSHDQKSMLSRTEGLSATLVPNTIPPASPSDAPRTDVLWIGEAVPWKQPELFLRLAVTIPNQNFTLLTRPVEESYFEQFVSKTRDIPNLGLENSVPYQEWPAYFKKAKLVVNTSRFDGFPFSFTQAFAYGIPVVSLSVNPDDVLEKNQLGTCAQGSELRLVQAVSDLIKYTRQWQHLSNNAYQYALHHQNPKDVIEIYRKLFIQCAGKIKRKRSKK